MSDGMVLETKRNGTEYAVNIAAAEKVCFSEPWSLKAVEEFLSYGYNGAEVVLCDGEFAGYVTYSCICGEIQIANVATLPEYRRKGVGSLLLESVLQIAKENECSVITLEVRASNMPAIALYKKHGYTEVGIRKGYYKNPTDDALLMNFEL